MQFSYVYASVMAFFHALGLDSCVVACKSHFESFACGVPFRVILCFVLYV
jgi:hypothetical protein